MQPVPLKIVFFVSLYEINGLCAVVKNLIDNLDSDIYKMSLLAEKVSERHYALDKNIEIIDLNLKPKNGLIRKIYNAFNHLYNIRKNIIKMAPDIVISSGSLPNCNTILAMSGLKKNIKLALIEHSEGFFIDYKTCGYKKKIIRRLYQLLIFFLYHRADKIITVSQNISNYVNKLFRIKAEQVLTIHNPVNINKIKKMSDEKIADMEFEEGVPSIVTFSRLSHEKNIALLIESFSHVVKKMDSRLLIIGDGNDKERLINLSVRHNIQNKVIFCGYKENPFKYVKKADVFVLTSFYEGFPNVVLESMACGTPVISTLCGNGIREIISNGINGLLVEKRDPLALANSIILILSDKELKETIIKEATIRLQEFDIAPTINKYESAIFKIGHPG